MADLRDLHFCGHCGIGSYDGQAELIPPDFLRRKNGRGICVDVCLALEISELWHKHRIRTTGCCCGRGKTRGYIGVVPDQIDRMKALGYQVRPNDSRPGAEDSFYPKTRFTSADELDPVTLERAAEVADEAAKMREALFKENGASINASKAVQAEEIAAAIRSLKKEGGGG